MPAETAIWPLLFVSVILRAMVSVLPPVLDSVVVSLLPIDRLAPAPSVPPPELLVIFAPSATATVLVTLAEPAMSSVAVPTSMVPVPAVAVAPLMRSAPATMAEPPA